MPSIWNGLDDLVKDQSIFTHDIVYKEIVSESGAKDDLEKWLERYKRICRPISQRQLEIVPGIVKKYPKLIDSESKKEQADPWLIALLVELMEGAGIFGGNSDYVLVSMESQTSEQKIPAVCKDYSVRHMTLFDFFDANDWKIGIVSHQKQL